MENLLLLVQFVKLWIGSVLLSKMSSIRSRNLSITNCLWIYECQSSTPSCMQTPLAFRWPSLLYLNLNSKCRFCTIRYENLHNKSVGKKILNTTFYPDQKGINKFIKGKSVLKRNKQVKTKNFESDRNVKNMVLMIKRLCDHLCIL